jgi:hypothetical protein
MSVCKTKYCDYCHSDVTNGQRWVRRKTFSTRADTQGPAYHYYHAEPLAGLHESCWEKHQIEIEVVSPFSIPATTRNHAVLPSFAKDSVAIHYVSGRR